MTAASAELAARIPHATTRAAFGQTTAHVPVEHWLAAATAARDLGCTAFDWLGAEDAGRPGASGVRHAVLLHVLHPGTRQGVLLRTEVGDEPLPSVAGLWAGAAWHEREAAEMFGLALTEPVRRLLLPDAFDGHPLRKDFVLVSRVVRAWPGRLEPGEDGSSAPSRRRAAPPGVPDPSWGPRPEGDHRA
ncbi:NADH-quinone oxidoreductase subunit C [Saccharothrix algeriensis]|uniref:NADH-quinone oxidoreductase subunit C n=1 Tax=Saccharothrix algeriensis TaxID=173560 RepID=A0A8T8HS08_9PSEU|nr:NADH-quinone oxidoreductase subunit C [Saccharothrix algeriensis]MBM7812648.1 NADH-quinone oxidoreductase subunit C [Saccharothrix algeriensis]QTR01352.1 NADH-quinone oxidoreductase subunit C [Saccharothrix algeriensis]